MNAVILQIYFILIQSYIFLYEPFQTENTKVYNIILLTPSMKQNQIVFYIQGTTEHFIYLTSSIYDFTEDL